VRAIDRLVAIENIKLLRARWCRFLDERRWNDVEALLSDDASLDLSGATPELAIVRGAGAIRDFVAGRYGGNAMLLHLNFLPEIEILSENNATGIWRQEVFLKDRYVENVHHGHGYGTVHDRYEKHSGVWKIQSIYLKLDMII
jgi:hypothetical protein